jgi:uncharacterized protein (DUF3084 family)
VLIQCHIQREGSTHVNLERFHYEFKPRPELTGGDNDSKVAQVLSTSHQHHLLSLEGDFSAYKGAAAELEDKQTDIPAMPDREAEITLVERETALMRREEALNEREAGLIVRESELNEREIVLHLRESTLDDRAAELGSKADSLSIREEALNESAVELNERESRLKKK